MDITIMRSPNYLFKSRHHLFYFRFPIPRALHPLKRSTEIKVSLGTRDAKQALHLSRDLIYLAQRALNDPAIAAMEYQDLRGMLQTYFTEALNRIKHRIAKSGPFDEMRKAVLKGSQSLALNSVTTNDYSIAATTNLMSGFMDKFNLDVEPDSQDYNLIQKEFFKAYASFCQSALDHNNRIDNYQFEQSSTPMPLISKPVIKDNVCGNGSFHYVRDIILSNQ